MKILYSNQIRQADQYTIENEPISSINLMERASEAFAKKFQELYPNPFENILIFCGTGNNGGDGLAIARLLHQQDQKVKVFVIGDPLIASHDFKTNFDQLPKEIGNKHLQLSNDFPEIDSGCLIVDGLFGSGLTRPIEGLHGELIGHINDSKAQVISIDIASGLFADKPTTGEVIIQPAHTISFQVPKLAFMQPSLHRYVGEWHVVDIGLDQGFIGSLESSFSLTESEEMTCLVPQRRKFNHKGDAGRLIIVAGSKGKMGAAILAAKAAFRAGAGLVHVHSPSCGLDILQISIPEAMANIDEQDHVISSIEIPTNINAIAIGPGIGTAEQTEKALYELIKNSTEPLILDADALNILSQNPDWLSNLPTESILTPHPGEFKKLVGEWVDDFDKVEKLQGLCEKYNLNVVLKGANSAVCDKDGNVFFNSTGNPGMATAGSGDVLTGIVGALLAQGLAPFSALRLAVYLHGKAGDIAADKFGGISMKASDITDNLHHAILSMKDS